MTAINLPQGNDLRAINKLSNREMRLAFGVGRALQNVYKSLGDVEFVGKLHSDS